MSFNKTFNQVKKEISKTSDSGFGFGFLWPKSQLVAKATFLLFEEGIFLSPAHEEIIESWANRAVRLGGAA